MEESNSGTDAASVQVAVSSTMTLDRLQCISYSAVHAAEYISGTPSVF